mgnify:FL=1
MYQSQYNPSFLKGLCFYFNDVPLDSGKKLSECKLPTECALVCKAFTKVENVEATITYRDATSKKTTLTKANSITVKALATEYLTALFGELFDPVLCSVFALCRGDEELKPEATLQAAGLSGAVSLVCKAKELSVKPAGGEVTITVTFQNEKDHPVTMKVESTRTVEWVMETYLGVGLRRGAEV